MRSCSGRMLNAAKTTGENLASLNFRNATVFTPSSSCEVNALIVLSCGFLAPFLGAGFTYTVKYVSNCLQSLRHNDADKIEPIARSRHRKSFSTIMEVTLTGKNMVGKFLVSLTSEPL